MNYMDRKEAIDLLFSEIIEVYPSEDQFIAIEQVTHMIGVGKTQDDAIANLKDAILNHIDGLKSMLETTKIAYYFKTCDKK